MSVCNLKMYKSKRQCDFCNTEFNDIRDLAIHRLDHLEITVPFLSICPFCDKQSTILAELLQHILDHLMGIDKLQQAQLVKWLASQYHEDKNRSSINHKRFDEFYISLPSISFNLKCLFCDKLYAEDKSVEHVLEHFSSIISSRKRRHLRLWFKKFFEREESHAIVTTYYTFVEESRRLDSESNLLEKLPLFENEKSNTCRFCQITLDNASNLFRHCVEWHVDVQAKAWNCPICNFKEYDGEKFVEHIFKKHMACVLCRKKNSSFDESLKHAKVCLRGCPYCRQKLKFEQLLQHFNADYVNLICPFCREQILETDHLKGHMRECISRPSVLVFCPLCKNAQFDKEQQLRDHLKECKPWIPVVVNNKMPCSGSVEPNSRVAETKFIKFSDIKEHVSPKIAGIIAGCYN